MGKDIHKKSFSEETLQKLQLYENYLTKWLPTFVARKNIVYGRINIFDFFCGPGHDSKNTPGSPIIALNVISDFISYIDRDMVDINLYFNDKDRKKIRELEIYIKTFDAAKHPKINITITVDNFEDAFKHYKKVMQQSKAANLLFIDQNGIKHVTPNIFFEIVNIPTTDLLFFCSSSYLKRFKILQKMIGIDNERVNECPQYQMHRLLKDHYLSLVPENRRYFLGEFSIKKLANVYGLIFGSGHILGLKKFVEACWEGFGGDANFDIDEDRINPDAPYLFADMNKTKKLQFYERELKNNLDKKAFINTYELFAFTLLNGFLPKHAKAVFESIVKERILPPQKLTTGYKSWYPPNKSSPIKYHKNK